MIYQGSSAPNVFFFCSSVYKLIVLASHPLYVLNKLILPLIMTLLHLLHLVCLDFRATPLVLQPVLQLFIDCLSFLPVLSMALDVLA